MEALLPDGKTPRCQATKKGGVQCANGAQKGFDRCGPHKTQAETSGVVAEPTLPFATEEVPADVPSAPIKGEGWLSYHLTCTSCGSRVQFRFETVEAAMKMQARFAAVGGVCNTCRRG